MSIKPRTIDNLGIESSVRYAKDTEQFDPRLIEESSWIPQKTSITPAKPYIPTDFDLHFSLSKPIQLAHFFPPPGGAERSDFFFQTAILPTDSYEKQDAILEKLASFEETLKNLPASTSEEFQRIKEGIETKDKLTRMFQLIKARLNQFQRG